MCGRENAVLYIQEIINNKCNQIYICKSCEASSNIMEKFLEVEFDNINNNIEGISCNKFIHNKKKKKENTNKVCKSCGYSLDDFLNTNRLSCSKCYEYFKYEINKKIKKIHKKTKHIGNIANKYLSYSNIEHNISKYEEEITNLVKMEKYEQAAILRDKLNTLKSNLIYKQNKSKEKNVH